MAAGCCFGTPGPLLTAPMAQNPDRRFRGVPGAGRPRRRRLLRTLRIARPPLDDFDRLLDSEGQRLAAIHWTPARVCHRAAQLLDLGAGERVLDVGSGVGKLCLLGSLASPGQYVGVEQRHPLVLQARGLAAHLASTAQFLHADAFDVDWAGYEALYFFNPFDEVRFSSLSGWQIDGSIRMGGEVFEELVARTQDRLASLAIGTRVVTFHGIGGPMPSCYQRRVSERFGEGTLDLWVRASP